MMMMMMIPQVYFLIPIAFSDELHECKTKIEFQLKTKTLEEEILHYKGSTTPKTLAFFLALNPPQQFH